VVLLPQLRRTFAAVAFFARGRIRAYRTLAALQLGMVFLQALGVVVLYLYTLELVRHNGAALAAALTLLGSLSFFSLVGQLFPDLLTAAVLAGSLLCLARLRRNPQSLLPLAILGALAGLGPYLHVKTVLMSLTLLLLGLLHCWRNGRSKTALACLLVPATALLAIYAGDNNPMLVSFAETHHIRPDLAVPIFSQDLQLNGGTAAIQLIVGIGVMLAMLLGGIVVAQQKRTEAHVRDL
jgi:hypothetical protein